MKTTIRCGRGPRLALYSAATVSLLRSEFGSAPPAHQVPAGENRIGLVARDDAEERALTDMVAGGDDPSRLRDDRIFFEPHPVDGLVVLMFPGQGSQRSGMFSGLRAALPSFDSRLADLASVHPLGRPVLEMIGRDRDEGRDALLTQTQHAQPALGLVCSALAAELERFGVEPDLTIGHSFGELVALSVAGAMGPGELLRLSVDRGRSMARAGQEQPGRMLAVLAGPERARSLLSAAGVPVEVAAINGDSQIVVAGSPAAIEEAQRALSAGRVRCSPLRTSAAFHSSSMAPARAEFGSALRAATIRSFPPGVVGANATGSWHTGEPGRACELLARQLTEPVRWRDNLRNAYDRGGRIFIEVGPGNALRNLCRQALDGVGADATLTLALDPGPGPAEIAWLSFLARLGSRGVPVRDPDGAYRERIDVRPAANSFDDSSPATVGPRAGAPDLDVVSTYLNEAARQVDAYFARQVDLLDPPVDPSIVRTALELNASVVNSFLEAGARVVGVPRDGSGTRASVQPAAPSRAAPADADDEVVHEVRRALASLTGHAVEEISLDLRLEDDLGIVSIALVELLAEYNVMAVEELDDAVLVNTVTVGDLVDCLRSRSARTAPASEPETPAIAGGLRSSAASGAGEEPVLRFRFSRVAMEAGGALPSRVLIVSADHELAGELRAALEAAGGTPAVWGVEDGAFVIQGARHPVDAASVADELGKFFGAAAAAVIFATARTPATSTDVRLTGLALSALARSISARWPRGERTRLGVVVPAGSAAEAMTAIGHARALQKEWPAARIRAVRFEADDPGGDRDGPPDLAGLAAMLLSGPSETRMFGDASGRFWRETHTPAPARGAGGRSAGSPRRIGGAVLAVGGGDGITAETVVGLAQRFRCPIAVLGRTRFPEAEVPGPGREQALLRTRERVERAGAEFLYCQADATDAGRVDAALEQVRERFGSIGGLILGAGILREARIERKARAVEAEVLATKLRQVRVLRAALEGSELDFALLFSSISSYTGNVAQSDYVAANLAFEELGAEWNRSVSYPVRSILWSVWHETGLAPQWVKSKMAGNGLQGIGNAVGVQRLLDELDLLDDSPERVLLAPDSVIRYLLPESDGRG